MANLDWQHIINETTEGAANVSYRQNWECIWGPKITDHKFKRPKKGHALSWHCAICDEDERKHSQ